MVRRTERSLENIPVGELGLIPLLGCTEMDEKVNEYLVQWRKESAPQYQDDVAFNGYSKDTFLIESSVPRFGSGEAKGIINEFVRSMVLFLFFQFYYLCSKFLLTDH